jgi:hypothetical protein
MKKTLYSTTVLAAAGLLTLGASDAFAQAAAPAAPEKLKLTLGGFMNQYIGYVDQQNNGTAGYKHFDQKSDSEIYFTGSVKLDNGITASVVVQMEADTGTHESGDALDESYLRLDTGLGQFRLGQSDAAGLALQVSAPWVGINFFNNDQAQWIVNPSSNVAGVGSTTIGGADDNRVYYITPSLAGFRAGASYAASTTENGQTQPLVTETDVTDVSLQWAGNVGDFGLRASAGYWWNEGSTSTASASNRNLSLGGDVTFADITVGAGWLRKSAKEGDANGADGTSWNAGIRYRPGPWSIALTYANAEADGSRANENEDKVNRWALGATYAIGPGVNAMTNVLYHHYRDESPTVEGNEGVAVIGGIQLSF